MTPSEFMSLLFEIEITAHIEHLKSKTLTHAKHETLNDLYQDIVGLRDRWAESYQGKYGLLAEINVNKEDNSVDIVKYLSSCASDIETFYLKVKDGFLKQIMDDILELIYSTIYKLRFAK